MTVDAKRTTRAIRELFHLRVNVIEEEHLNPCHHALTIRQALTTVLNFVDDVGGIPHAMERVVHWNVRPSHTVWLHVCEL